jgi:hypothetical protein
VVERQKVAEKSYTQRLKEKKLLKILKPAVKRKNVFQENFFSVVERQKVAEKS